MKAILQLFHPVAEKTGKGADEYLKPIMAQPLDFKYEELLAISVALGCMKSIGGVGQTRTHGAAAQVKVEAALHAWKVYVKENS